MKVFEITEEWSCYGETTQTDTIAICATFRRAIQYLIDKHGLNSGYIISDLFGKNTSLKDLYGENWVEGLVEDKVSYFLLDGTGYEIIEQKVLE